MRKHISSVPVMFFAAILTAFSAAQGPPPQGSGLGGPPRGPRPITVEQITPNVYWVRNVGFGAFIVGDKGVITIDTGGSLATGKQIVESVAKVTPLPITTLILSHDDADHVDGIGAFPAGMEIIAQENTKKFISEAIASGDTGPEAPKVPAAYLPNHTVAKREVRTIDGVKLELLHWAPAHTNADLVVYLPEQKLVLLGDLLVMDQHNLPLIHMEKGGTSKGWIESVKGVLALDATKYVVGHEGIVGRDGIEKQLQAATAEREKVKQLYDKGKSLAEIQAAVGDPIPSPPGAGPKGPPHFPPYSEVLYTELKEGRY